MAQIGSQVETDFTEKKEAFLDLASEKYTSEKVIFRTKIAI